MIHELVVERLELGLDSHVVGFLNDREVLEDGEVEQAALGLGGAAVGALVAVHQSERFVESGHDVVDLVLGGLSPLFDLRLLLADPSLLGSQHVFGHGVTVVELDELLLLGGEFAQAAGMSLAFAVGDLRFPLDVLAHGAPDLLAFPCGQPVGGVDGVEVVLDQAQPDVARATWAAAGDAAEAGVVLVLDAHLAAVAAVAVASAAGAADDLAGQVVVVFVAAAAAGAVAVEHRLDAVEGVLVDERLVTPAHLRAAVGDGADVVVVAQHAVHRVHAQRLRWAGGGGTRAQAGLTE